MEYKNDFKNRLIEAIYKRNIKQIDLAERTQISRAQINEYIKGKCKPKQDKLHKLALVLDVDPAWLLGYDVPMENKNDTKVMGLDVGTCSIGYHIENAENGKINNIIKNLKKLNKEQLLMVESIIKTFIETNSTKKE